MGHNQVRPIPTDIAKYSIELFNRGGEGAGIEEILDRHADLNSPDQSTEPASAVSRATDHAL